MNISPGPDLPGRPSPVGARRRARERALELLYEAETKDVAPHQVIEELPIAPEPYAVELVLGVERLGDKVSDLLSLHATGWAVDRMPVIDRCLLKMATFELLDELEVPVAVVLDEAVELAKSYSTEDSGRFVNGVLSAIAPKVREIEPEKTSAVSPNWLE